MRIAQVSLAGADPPLRQHFIPSALSWLPKGEALPLHAWTSRHRWVVVVLAVQAAGIPIFGLLRGFPLVTSLREALLPLILAALAWWPRLGRPVRSSIASLGLMVTSGVIVHLAGGAIEAHFLFFVMVPVVALYENWVPFGLAVGYVLIQHGLLGTLNSSDVYNHHAAQASPWRWAAIHAGLFAASAVGALVNWKLHETARSVETTLSAALAHHAHHDALTGLPNRRLFSLRMAQSVQVAQAGGQQPTLLILDLDGFKGVNDTFGHDVGDLLLIETANRLRACLREQDTVARFGGDEFAVLITDADPTRGEHLAQRIVDALNKTFDIEGVTLDIEVSVGIATARTEQDTDVVIREADAAMYQAKVNRLGLTRFDPDATQHAADRLSLLGALRRALDSNEIELHYQPKISTATGELVGAEALARWRHPTRGLLGPAIFIPVLEGTNLIHRFTAYVLARALAQARTWHLTGNPVPVAVNVSTRCLLDPTFPDTVAEALATAGVPGELLCIEITENTVMADPEQAIDVLRRIRAMNVKTAIDDFGTGYSSMAYLKILPIDELKLDRSFVRDMATDHNNHVLVESLVELGHNLGMEVVAEGVEDSPTLTALRQIGCDVVQGYHLAHPLAPVDFAAFLATATASRARHAGLELSRKSA